jgi:hypothetical protein
METVTTELRYRYGRNDAYDGHYDEQLDQRKTF